MVRQSMGDTVHGGLLDTNVIKMDTNLMFQNLLDYNAAKRVEMLIIMRKLLKDGNQLPTFHDAPRIPIFEILFHVLEDTRWEVRYQCLLLICAMIPDITDELDACISIVLQKVISNLGHENVNVRRSALQVLHNYMKCTNNLQNFQENFIRYGLENPEYIVRKGCIMSIGILFASGFENENLFPLIECLSKHFVDGDASLFYPIFLAMQKIHELVGTLTFEHYLQKLDEEAANTYLRVLNKFTINGSRMSSSSGSRSSFSNLNGVVGASNNKLLKYDFGIFQPYITEKIKSDDWKTRVEAIEHMKMMIREIPDFSEKISDMDEYMIFLSRLLEDSNFKIVIQTLSVYDLLIDKFKNQMKRFLKTFVTSVLKRLGDAKLVVREHAIRVIHKLMHYVKPTDVLGNLLQFKDSRNPRLREEIINRVTGAVLTFPSYNFEFLPLCEAVAPLLADTKRRVRLAALECFAALAQAMGPTRLVPLVTAVDVVEINSDAEGLLAAVQARLARRILPRCTEDGAVSYAIMLPSSAGVQNRNVSPWGPDIEWIMAASGSSSSSTPPSRSKDVLAFDIENNGESSVSKLVEINHLRHENANVFKRNSNWVNNSVQDAISSYPDSQNTDQETLKRDVDDEYKNSKSNPVFGFPSDKVIPALSETYQETFSMTPNPDNPKTRPVIVNSKIPVLARLPGKKQVLEESEMPLKTTPLRALSAQRHNTLPSFNVRYSAAHRRSSSHFSQENRVLNIAVDKANPENVLRKISPSATQIGRQPILVRSPSLSSLGQFQSDVNSGNHVFYGAYSPPPKNMGNIGSYFRQSPGGVVVAQPTPVHLDDVNVFGVTVLGENGKMSSNPTTEGWEILHSSSHSDSKTDNWQKSVEGMPEVYEMHVDSPATYGRKIVTSPLNVVDNGNISIAKITREKMLKRQQEIMKEAEEKRLNKEREHNLLEQKVQVEQAKQNTEAISPIPDNIPNKVDFEIVEDLPPDDTEPPPPPASRNENSTPLPKPATPEDKQVPTKTPVVQQYKRLESARSKGSAKPLSRSSSLKTPSALRKVAQNSTQARNSQTLKHNLAASSLALFDESSDEVATYPNPNEALKKALKSLSTDTWMGKIEGIRTIQRLSKSHPDVLQLQLHAVVLALLTEVKNLRSSVSRAAILAIGDLFVTLKKNVEPDLDLITSTLLSKCGETVGFIRDDIEKVMNHLIDTITPCKAALSIIAGGASHRNGAVRKVAAQSLLAVVEKMGAARILTSSKDVTERLIPTTAQFLMDGMPLTRWYGRRIYQILMQHPSFDKLLLRYVQPSTLRNINSILDSIRKKGAGDMPKEGVSARTLKNETHRNGHLNRTM
ncbi:TOG array regulator of axonemal microtubules protein 1-like isoform X2 [Argiope bruennichi]|uniref:TOG array regulator of axonemal microtubules protein 1-like isoform X2 n=1 Tax=Argiope bruennichi TaxID=94029 RepID=UPI0024946722|nr:TOG array regulator of axonemal microtubules protein 1-like isoform X2 [Argiope bruennichi]